MRAPSPTPYAPDPARQIGVVKWFDPAKSYGFIIPALSGEELFVHARDIRALPRSLADGQEVSYIAKRGPKGAFASDVTPVAT